MIVFKRIKVQNFLSVGNDPVELSLNDHFITTITGENGSAKSAICIDSIFYALYGKSFRKVKLSNLINSINNKNLLVEIEFSINENDYKIIRGQKPNKFEIYINGTLKQQLPNVKDYQLYLTNHILKMDEKTFRQLVIIGSSSYTPFMSLSASERRTVIEDLLRIDIFSYMKDIVKQYISDNNSLITDISYKISSLNMKIEMQKKSDESKIDELKNIIVEEEHTKKSFIEKKNDFETEYNNKLKEIDKDEILEEKNKIDKIKDTINKFQQLKAKKSSVGDLIDEHISFFSNNSVCPTCSQHIEKSFVDSKLIELHERKKSYQEFVSGVNNKISDLMNDSKKLVESYNKLIEKWNSLQEIRKEISILESNINLCDSKISSLMNRISNEENNKKNDNTVYQAELDNLENELKQLQNKSVALSNISSLLKDDGVKSIIIKNYLPVMNNLIKKYLSIIEFNINFELDENFNEIIKSKNKESFEYNNFSEGEHLRIDTAIMFAFRELAKIQSSISTNLLILDEFDRGTLDYQGFQSIVTILQSCKNENIFIISHSPEYFTTISDRTLTARKKNGYSKLYED